MKRIILHVSICLSFPCLCIAQGIDTVSIRSNYTQQVWYRLLDGHETNGSKDDWDLGFEITGYTASIIANTQKTNFALYKAPYTISSFEDMDTLGINTWPLLYNADTSWSYGAFNKGIDLNNSFDLGWGIYDMNSHVVNGDSCYVIKLAPQTYKKLYIDQLAGGVYYFAYANLDGSELKEVQIAKSAYAGKNFAYYDLTNHKAVDREPISSNWDLTFTKYTGILSGSIPYGVTGVLQNKGVTVAQAGQIEDIETYRNYSVHTFTPAINEIGYDWKSYDFNTNSYIIANTVYFVKDKSSKIWKLVFTSFGGSANGDVAFSKEQLQTTNINDVRIGASAFSIYPNPTINGELNILFESNTSTVVYETSITSATGEVVHTQRIQPHSGFSQATLHIAELPQGLYQFTVKSNGKQYAQKFIKQ